MAPGTTCPAPRLYCSGGDGAADQPNQRRDRRHEPDTPAIRARPLRGLRNQDLRSSADRSPHARLAGSAPARDDQLLTVLTAPPDTGSLEAPQARLVPRLSLGVLRQPTTRRKTADRTLANERYARPSASLDPSEQEDASTRPVCPASATRWHPTARTPCPRLRRTAQNRRRVLSLVERCRSSRALRRHLDHAAGPTGASAWPRYGSPSRERAEPLRRLGRPALRRHRGDSGPGPVCPGFGDERVFARSEPAVRSIHRYERQTRRSRTPHTRRASRPAGRATP